MDNKKTCCCQGDGAPDIDELIEKNRNQPGGAFKVLHQYKELYGNLPAHIVEKVALGFDKTPAEIEDIIYSYDLLQHNTPGAHRISICLGTSCYLHGSQSVLQKLCAELGIAPGETTPDGQFYLEVVRCLGACDVGPALMVDNEIYPYIKADSVAEILDKYRQAQ